MGWHERLDNDQLNALNDTRYHLWLVVLVTVQLPEEILNGYLKEKSIRFSEQRNHIFNIFLNTEKHVTAVELYHHVKKKHPEIGYATVYRALKVICDANLADVTDFGDGVRRFEPKYGLGHHDHLICMRCGLCVEVVNARIEVLQEQLAKEHGFSLKQHKLHLFGICKECGKKINGK